MRIKVLLCNCKGLCGSFKDADMNTLPFQVESDLDVEYTVLHPQLCGQGGNAVLTEALATADSDTYVVVGACAPTSRPNCSRRSSARPDLMSAVSFHSTFAAPTTKVSWSAFGRQLR